ncbi:MAG: adenylosuccinate lyase [Deltaproteobacteria bacterium]|nr:adenylosuccinate lyase [Deltaproteobacteria bacterium]
MNVDLYQEPLVSRYTSKEMQKLFSERTKFTLWRRCWLALAESFYELDLQDEDGKPIIKEEQIQELKDHLTDINFEEARKKEEEIRHDVMSHIYAYGKQCPNAAKIIHLGATSAFVTCNSELIQQREGLKIIKRRLLKVIKNLADFAIRYKGIVTLAYTHFQPAQPTTIGKRATLYIQDLLMDLEYLEFVLKMIKARGVKGTTGTQASFLELFHEDHEKVKKLDKLVSLKLGFDNAFDVTGQTYPRKLDTKIAEVLAGIATSSHKFGVDMRLASHLKIMEEPFEKAQVGSSAMAYKRNPMRSERLTALSRLLIGKIINFYHTAANQWLERSLDDSAIRRIDIPQSFLLADAILILYNNITKNMIVYPKVVEKHLKEELPFMVTEAILMKAVERGKDRQQIHERIRIHSMEAAKRIKEEGKNNDLFERIANDPIIPIEMEELNKLITDPIVFAGRAKEQTEEYIHNIVEPTLLKYEDILKQEDEGKVRY